MGHYKVYQSNIINSLLFFNPKACKADSAGIFYYREYPDTFAVRFEDQENASHFSKTAHRLLMYIMSCYAQYKESTIVFYLSDYMSCCALESYQETRRQVRRDLKAIVSLEYYYNGLAGRIANSFSLRNKTVIIELAPSFLDELDRETFIELPAEYFHIDIQKCIYAQSIVWYLLVLKYLNAKKSNRGRISIKSILEHEGFPTLEEIQNTSNRSIKERLYNPLFRNLQAVNKVIPLEFYFEKQKTMWESVQKMDYYHLLRVIVHYK